MTVQSVIDMANHGEFRQLAVSDDADAVVSYINLGVVELYKRFVLNTEEVIIELGKETVPSDPYQKISETIYQMPEDYMYITNAYEQDGAVIPINKEHDPLSINTISWNQIQIPTAHEGSMISILYVKSPDFVTSANLTAQVQIPVQLLEALLNYIGYRGHSAADGSIKAENTTHYQRFEASVARAKDLGLITADDLYTEERFTIKGFA